MRRVCHHVSVHVGVAWVQLGRAGEHALCGAWAKPEVGCRVHRHGLGRVGEGRGRVGKGCIGVGHGLGARVGDTTLKKTALCLAVTPLAVSLSLTQLPRVSSALPFDQGEA